MHIDVVPNRGSPPAILLRQSYREDGKTKDWLRVSGVAGLASANDQAKTRECPLNATIFQFCDSEVGVLSFRGRAESRRRPHNAAHNAR